MERGQVLVVVALSLVGIIAIMGLALDVGVMFIENARLRRAVDAAALAAALQFREGYTTTDLDRSAQEFLILNGIHDPHATVDTCSTDATLCTNPQRKLVRVVARATAPLAFLPVIGIDSAPIGAMAVSETASVDVVLVFDRSESMTYDAAVGNSMRDPSVCNASSASPQGYVGDCEPFNTVKDAAISFVNQLYFPYDRVAVVTFDQKPNVLLHFSNVKATVVSTISNLTVFQESRVVTRCNCMNFHTSSHAYAPSNLFSVFFYLGKPASILMTGRCHPSKMPWWQRPDRPILLHPQR